MSNARNAVVSATPRQPSNVCVEQKQLSHFPSFPVARCHNLARHKMLHLLSLLNIRDGVGDDDDGGIAYYLGSASCRRKYTNNNETYKNIILPHNWAYFVLNCLLRLVNACTVADAREQRPPSPSLCRVHLVFTRVIVHSAPSTTTKTKTTEPITCR